jgi:3-isopropylmalate/(R)-2-methylmalate dehydratase small subunit
LRVDLEKGLIENLTTGNKYQASPFPEFMREIISEGGLVEYVKKRLQA